jgi:hypothetical protein
MRSQFGTVGLVLNPYSPEDTLETPAKGSYEGAKRGAATAVGSLGGSMLYANPGSGPGAVLVLLAWIALIPVAATIGAVGGASSSLPEATVEVLEAKIRNTISASVNGGLTKIESQILATSREGEYLVVPVPDKSYFFSAKEVSYKSLVNSEIDTVLEIQITAMGLEGPQSVDPPLALFMVVQSRLIKTKDDREIFSRKFIFKSEQKKFIEWGENDASLVRKEMSRLYKEAAETIGEGVFLGQRFYKGSGKGYRQVYKGKERPVEKVALITTRPGTTYIFGGVVNRVYSVDGKYFKDQKNPSGEVRVLPGKHTLGVEHLTKAHYVTGSVNFLAEAGRVYHLDSGREDEDVYFWLEDAETGEVVSEEKPPKKLLQKQLKESEMCWDSGAGELVPCEE